MIILVPGGRDEQVARSLQQLGMVATPVILVHKKAEEDWSWQGQS